MDYRTYQNRVAAFMNRDDLGVFIPEWINEVRDEICLYNPFSFQLRERSETYVLSQATYYFDATVPPATTNRFSGIPYQIIYDDGDAATVDKKLSVIDPHLFARLYPQIQNGNPVGYSVEGDQFTIDHTPALDTPAKTFRIKYYALPDVLVDDDDEEEIDKRFYNTVIAGVCARASEYMKNGNLTSFWNQKYETELRKMIAQDSGLRLTDVKLRTEFDIAQVPEDVAK